MKAILVGCGGMGRLWTQYVTRYAGWEVAAAADVSEEALSRYSQELGYPRERCFNSLGKALDSASADVLIVTTPADRHKECILAGLAKGIHVITEKPAVTSWNDALELSKAARRSRGKLMVSQNYRYYHSTLALREFVDSGAAGRASFGTVLFQRGSGGAAPRIHSAQHGEPFLIEMAIHHFDTMRAILKSDPVRVYAKSWTPAWAGWAGHANAFCLFEFDKGVNVCYSGVWATWRSRTEFPGTWVLDFEKGQINWDGQDVGYTDAEGNERIIFNRSQIPGDRPVRVLEGSVKEFASAIAEGREPETNMADNLKTLAMVFASIESSRRGEAVEISEFMHG